ncbi:MAG TPA: response regulator, partial [bacterium]|nr:response regulator [bacterium]
MKVLIIEDEPVAADHVASLLRRIMPNVEIAGQIATVREAVLMLRQNRFDLILSDIQLADGS